MRPGRRGKAGMRRVGAALAGRAGRVRLVALLGMAVAGASSAASPGAAELLCPGLDPATCREVLCGSAPACPLIAALSNDDVFHFVERVAPCDACDLPVLAPGKGIGRCVEYSVEEGDGTWTVALWVSERCAFRHGSPAKARIEITLAEDGRRILATSPPLRYVADPDYCERDADCQCLSGSGVELVGCANQLHAALARAGSYECASCACRESRCVEATTEKAR